MKHLNSLQPPQLEAPEPKQKQKPTDWRAMARGVFVLFAIIFVLASLFGSDEKTTSASNSSQGRQTNAAQGAKDELTDEERGFHCLSPFSGAHRNLNEAVTESLRDPDSFEHIGTRIGPRSADGTHKVIMQYRARNGFGGFNVESAIATIRSSDCSLVTWRTQGN